MKKLLANIYSRFKNLIYFCKSKLSASSLYICTAALFITLTGNFAMFSRLLEVYPLPQHTLFLCSLFLFFYVTACMLLAMLLHGRWMRWGLALVLLLSASAAFYMDSFGVIIDDVMLENVAQSDIREVKGLISVALLLRLFFLGVIPAWIAIKFAPKTQSFVIELKSKLTLLLYGLIFLFLIIVPFLPSYIDFVREHRTIRFYANPSYYTYSTILFLKQKLTPHSNQPIQRIAQDAVLAPAKAGNKKHLFILVVGETARADRFSLNGYQKLTNPLLQKQAVLSFKNVMSCGTSTAISVPCMFSVLTRKEFDLERAAHMENALDVLQRQGVKVLWRDNNSDSKRVAVRVSYQDFKTPTLNPVCKGECRDIGMLAGLDKFIQQNQQRDILIVLHQMGNHGPEYYRRYPDEFAKFQPICRKSRLKECDKIAYDNSYDNAILYTDYFLSSSIDFLKKHDQQFATAMLYVADHGESLGENNIYLHAAPYAIAPIEQKHIPAILWVGQQFEYPLSRFQQLENYPLSHDDLFCSLLLGFHVRTQLCAAFADKFAK